MDITFVSGDDWQALYVNGKIVLQEHRLRIEDVLAALGIYCEVKCPNQVWMEELGYLPSDILDVVFDE